MTGNVVRLKRPTDTQATPIRFRPDDSVDAVAYSGWLIIVIFFGVLGVWAALAPLNSAVVADALVKVDGNRKSIQHPEGGMVREILVKEGDTVRADQPLIVLDDTQNGSEYDAMDKILIALRLTESRLSTELSGGTSIVLPAEFKGRHRDAVIVEALHRQESQMAARRREQEGMDAIVEQRIAQLRSQIAGEQSRLVSFRSQRLSLDTELRSLKPLFDRGYVTRARILEMERSIAAMEGQIGEVGSAISRAEGAMSEERQKQIQYRNQRAAAIAQELRDVELHISEITPKLTKARLVNERTVVRAPYAGRIIDLRVFAVGAVIGRGEHLMDIVPEAGSLVVAARVAVDDITEIAEGMTAEVRLTGYDRQTTPALRGTVTLVSADRLTDDRSGAAFYEINVRIDDTELAGVQTVHLRPGMPATVTIPTSARSAFSYFVSPLSQAFDRSLSER